MRSSAGKVLSKSVKMLYMVNAMNSHPHQKNTTKEVVGVEGVGEPHNEPDRMAIATDLFDTEHGRRAPRGVAVAGGEEELGQPPCPPPP